jgi:hypothetical protein
MAITIKDITQLPSGIPDANEPIIFGRGTNLFKVTRDQLFGLISQGITDLSFRLIESNDLYDENSGVNILNNVDITIGAGELVFFNVDVIDANQTLSNNTYVIPLSSGVYNPLGATLTIDDLYLLKREVLNSNFGGDANTVTYTEATLADVNNAGPALDFSDSDLIYFLELDNGFYRFNGVNGLYGSGELQMTFNDLIQVGQAEIIQESKVVTFKVNEQTTAEAVSQFNSLNPTVSIKDVSSFKLRANFTDFTVTPIQTTTRIYTLISKPDNDVELTQGNYGASANQITANHLLIDYETESTSQDIEQSANEVIDFGNIDPDDIVTFINNSVTDIVLQDSAIAITLIKSVQNGVQTDYIYIGSGGTYGDTAPDTILSSDLNPLDQDPPTFANETPEFLNLVSPTNEIDMSNTAGNYYNLTSPTSEISFNLINKTAGAFAMIRVNANTGGDPSLVTLNETGDLKKSSNDSWVDNESMTIGIFVRDDLTVEWEWNKTLQQ